MKITIVPAWLNRIIEANGLSLADACDYEKMASILSDEDVFLYAHANNAEFVNEYTSAPLPARFIVDFPEASQALWDKMVNHVGYDECRILAATLLTDTRRNTVLGDLLSDKAQSAPYLGFKPVWADDSNLLIVYYLSETQTLWQNEAESVLEAINGRLGWDAVVGLESMKFYIGKVQDLRV